MKKEQILESIKEIIVRFNATRPKDSISGKVQEITEKLSNNPSKQLKEALMVSIAEQYSGYVGNLFDAFSDLAGLMHLMAEINKIDGMKIEIQDIFVDAGSCNCPDCVADRTKSNMKDKETSFVDALKGFMKGKGDHK